MNTKIMKKAYIYYTNGMKVREISRRIRNDYGVSIPEHKYSEWFGKKEHWNKIPDRQLNLIKVMYEGARNTEKICSYLNKRFSLQMTPSKLRNLAKTYNFKKGKHSKMKNSFITSRDEIEIVRKYRDGTTIKDLMTSYGFKTQKSITDVLKYHNINPWNEYLIRCEKEKTYNDFSMEKIDTPFKSYYLGLMATDGWVDEKNNRVSISLTDRDCIDFLSKNINCSYASYQKEGIQDFHIINLTSKKLYKEITNLGIHPRKTTSLYSDIEIPVPIEFYPEFIRGCIDGDGWIRKDGKEFFISSASFEFMNKIKNILEFLGMKNLSVKEVSKSFYWIRTGYKSNMLILNEIYSHPFGMSRKYLRINQ